MKYASITKIDRNLAIVRLRQSDSDLSLQDIANLFNISKTRVCAILRRYHEKEKLIGALPTKARQAGLTYGKSRHERTTNESQQSNRG